MKAFKGGVFIVKDRIVPKATTFIHLLLVSNVLVDLLPSSMIIYCLVGRLPTVHWLEPTHLTDVHAFGRVVHL